MELSTHDEPNLYPVPTKFDAVKPTLNQVSLNYQPTTQLIPTEHEMSVYQVMAKQAVESRFYRGIGDVAAVTMIMLAARELNIAPMQALNGGLQIIDGVIELSARTMSMMIRRAGHSLIVEESSDTRCVMVGKRADNGDSMRVTYTIEQARKAGLVKDKGGWVKNPEDMLFARCVSRISRRLFSDVIGNAYVTGEVSQIDAHETEEIYPPALPPEPSEEDLVTGFLEQFEDKDDKLAWLQYINTVAEKLKWTKSHTISEFVKDLPATMEKFNAWKKKQK